MMMIIIIISFFVTNELGYNADVNNETVVSMIRK